MDIRSLLIVLICGWSGATRAVESSRRDLLQKGGAGFFATFLSGLQAPAASVTPPPIPIDVFSPAVQDVDGSLVRSRVASLRYAWEPWKFYPDYDETAQRSADKQFLSPRDMDVVEDWIRQHPHDTELRDNFQLFVQTHEVLASKPTLDQLQAAWIQNHPTEPKPPSQIAENEKQALAQRLRHDLFDSQSRLAPLILGKLPVELGRNKSWVDVFGERIAQMELQLAHDYRVGIGQIHEVTAFGIYEKVDPMKQVKNLITKKFSTQHLQLYTDAFVDDYMTRLELISPHYVRSLRSNLSSGVFASLDSHKEFWNEPNRLWKIFGFEDFGHRKKEVIRRFKFLGISSIHYLLMVEPGVPTRLTEEYLGAIKKLNDLLTDLQQLPLSRFRDGTLSLVETTLHAFEAELATLPQRVAAQRHQIELQNIHGNSWNTPHPFPPANSSEWRTYGFTTPELAAAQAADWVAKLGEMGHAMGLASNMFARLLPPIEVHADSHGAPADNTEAVEVTLPSPDAAACGKKLFASPASSFAPDTLKPHEVPVLTR